MGAYIVDSLTKEVNTKSVAKISEFVWPFIVGAFAARCADKEIQMILPRLNFDKFAEEVILQKSESSTNSRMLGRNEVHLTGNPRWIKHPAFHFLMR